MAGLPSSRAAVETFLADLTKFTQGLDTKTRLGFESSQSFSISPAKVSTYTSAIKALISAIDRMKAKKSEGDRYNKGTGINTNDARNLLADLDADKALTLTPTKFKSLLEKLVNAKEFVEDGETAPTAQPYTADSVEDDDARAEEYYALRTPGARLAASASLPPAARGFRIQGTRTAGRKSSKIGNKFNRCVKSVRMTVRARPKSTKESAAIAICTKSVLQTRGRTMKRYRKKRLITCLLYTSPSPRDGLLSRMPSSA